MNTQIVFEVLFNEVSADKIPICSRLIIDKLQKVSP